MVTNRIHDRVPSVKKEDYWEISETKESKGEKQRDEDKGRRQREQDSFGESSDFIQMLSKDPRQYQREKLDVSQISKFTFRGVSTHREKAIVEVDISLIDGTLLKGAQIALSREMGMRLISRKPGEVLAVDQLVKGFSELSVALPQKPLAGQTAAKAQTTHAQAKNKTNDIAWYVYGLIGILVFAVVTLIYIFITA